MVTIVQAKPQYLSNIHSILTLTKHDVWDHKIDLTEEQLGQRLLCDKPKYFAGMALSDWDVDKCDQAGIEALLSERE